MKRLIHFFCIGALTAILLCIFPLFSETAQAKTKSIACDNNKIEIGIDDLAKILPSKKYDAVSYYFNYDLNGDKKQEKVSITFNLRYYSKKAGDYDYDWVLKAGKKEIAIGCLMSGEDDYVVYDEIQITIEPFDVNPSDKYTELMVNHVKFDYDDNEMLIPSFYRFDGKKGSLLAVGVKNEKILSQDKQKANDLLQGSFSLNIDGFNNVTCRVNNNQYGVVENAYSIKWNEEYTCTSPTRLYKDYDGKSFIGSINTYDTFSIKEVYISKAGKVTAMKLKSSTGLVGWSFDVGNYDEDDDVW